MILCSQHYKFNLTYLKIFKSIYKIGYAFLQACKLCEHLGPNCKLGDIKPRKYTWET